MSRTSSLGALIERNPNPYEVPGCQGQAAPGATESELMYPKPCAPCRTRVRSGSTHGLARPVAVLPEPESVLRKVPQGARGLPCAPSPSASPERDRIEAPWAPVAGDTQFRSTKIYPWPGEPAQRGGPSARPSDNRTCFVGCTMTARDPLTLLDQNEAHDLLLLGGLPGSGKSYYLAALVERGWKKFDDFQSKTPNDSTDFRDSRLFTDLVAALKAGERCVVADIRVIHWPYRESALRALTTEIGAVSLQFQIFENQPEICSRNVGRDPDRRFEDRLCAISHWSKHHSVPSDALLLRVWRSDT